MQTRFTTKISLYIIRVKSGVYPIIQSAVKDFFGKFFDIDAGTKSRQPVLKIKMKEVKS